ncbi:MAG TPA: glycerate kinase [Chthoniobacterales bacterium]|nr:glycerate kinase [Chthoniobacterales bacterium]
MHILIAPDKFKGSLSAREVADNIAAGLREVLPNATIEIVPMADGGEGTAEVVRQACAGEWVECNSHDALGRAVTARYVWLPSRIMAVMEMSEAAGMWRIAPPERDPFRANTHGVGEMLLHAAKRGAREITLGLGGSATNDGGFGLARALGFRFLGGDGVELNGPVSDLLDLEGILGPSDLFLPGLIAAVDVKNPLLGARGATRTFGPQKGVAPDQLDLLEAALTRLADIVARDLNCDFREADGAGAAGGLGFGLMSFCGATIRPGFDLVAEMIDLETAIQRADVVVTGEGSLDGQTLEGKTPAGVARLARESGKRVFAIVGASSESPAVRNLFDGLFVLARESITPQDSIGRAGELLRERARELGQVMRH